jgi:2,4-dienoyl-CoA reductase-like NADH-dependent reductase (Old Yellow Enzyme family)
LGILTLQKVTDAVHAKGSFIFLQLWALGRVADPTVLRQEGGFDVVGASPIPLSGNKESVPPRELTVAEIKEYVQLYAKAARNAMEAGFDGVEIHGANGYLLDQFLQSESNKRTDEYGGSIQNRIRFPLEVVDAVVKVVGVERTGVRISPWSEFQGKEIPAPCISGLH